MASVSGRELTSDDAPVVSVTETNGDGCSARRNIAEEDVGVVDLSESGNVLGNRNPLNNFVAAGRVGLDMEWCGCWIQRCDQQERADPATLQA